MSDWKMGTTRHWLNMETFILCVEEVACIRKVNLNRLVPETTGAVSSDWIPALSITTTGGEIVEREYRLTMRSGKR